VFFSVTSSKRYLGTLVEDEFFSDINIDCTFLNGEQEGQSLKTISKQSHWCIPTSCISEWESGDVLKERKKDLERFLLYISDFDNNNNHISDFEFECKTNSVSAESLAVGSSVGKAPATGMLALAATAAASALFFF
jgi:hypothetical protein